MYEERFYRKKFARDWFLYQAEVGETDILVKSIKPLNSQVILQTVKKYRSRVEDYIEKFPEFKNTLSCFSLQEPAPQIIREMVDKTVLLDIGPMASVAGAIAEFVGKELSNFSPQFIIENGGDIFIKKENDISLGIYAGEGNFINNFSISLNKPAIYLGVCTSSSFLGHSVSLGRADLVTAVSDSVIFADALATKIANMINNEEDIEKAIDFSKKFSLTKGILIVKNQKLGLWGNLKIFKNEKNT